MSEGNQPKPITDNPAPPFFPRKPPRPPQRINPWRAFISSTIPNWLQCRPEIRQGAKLAYARLAQHAGKDGECFPKQKTLAAELGVCERTANEYVRILVKNNLIEIERPGLCMSNRYYFLDHPWMHEGQPSALSHPGEQRQKTSAQDRQNSSAQEPHKSSAPIIEENHIKGESEQQHTRNSMASGIPQSVEEATTVARRLGIEEAFAIQEFHAKKAIGWKDGYGNPIVSWPDHLQARWPVEQRKCADRRSPARGPGKRPAAPQRQFSSGDYNQSLKDF